MCFWRYLFQMFFALPFSQFPFSMFFTMPFVTILFYYAFVYNAWFYNARFYIAFFTLHLQCKCVSFVKVFPILRNEHQFATESRWVVPVLRISGPRGVWNALNDWSHNAMDAFSWNVCKPYISPWKHYKNPSAWTPVCVWHCENHITPSHVQDVLIYCICSQQELSISCMWGWKSVRWEGVQKW